MFWDYEDGSIGWDTINIGGVLDSYNLEDEGVTVWFLMSRGLSDISKL